MGFIKLHTRSCGGVEIKSRAFQIRVLNGCDRLGSRHGRLICDNISPDSYYLRRWIEPRSGHRKVSFLTEPQTNVKRRL
jgi:hypothetical protein